MKSTKHEARSTKYPSLAEATRPRLSQNEVGKPRAGKTGSRLFGFRISPSSPELGRGRASLEFPCAEQGFTLLEIIVSFGIFFAVIVISIGAVIAIDRAQAKAANFQIIQDNLRFAAEFLTKEIRSGTNYVASSCTGSFCREIDFEHSKPAGGTENIGFCLRNNAIYWMKEGASGCEDATGLSVPLTSDDIIVDDLKFYIVQSPAPPKVQPRVTILIHAHSANSRYATDFRLQTSIVQRFRQ